MGSLRITILSISDIMAELSTGNITLRKASLGDANSLLLWRNDPETRTASKSSEPISFDVHIEWLTRVLDDPSRKLYIGELKGTPFGSARSDYSKGVWELSWSVASEFRGQGLAKTMVALLADNLNGEIRAQIKTGNVASMRVAHYANMQLDHHAHGILYYSRKKATTN